MSTDNRKCTGTPAVVLGLGVTGLGVVRALESENIETYGVAFASSTPGRFSRYCQVVNRWDDLDHLDRLLPWLLDYLRKVGRRPVLLPTSDKLALFIAEHFDKLSIVARCSTTSLDHFRQIVYKNKLYAAALNASISPPPFLTNPTLLRAKEWCAQNPPPYLLKPAYQEASTNSIKGKNLSFAKVDETLEFLDTIDARDMILMRILTGGDGYIFDTYGYCNRKGRVVTLASHRRLRQQPPDFGSTCYGEVPGVPDFCGENALFQKTIMLLEKLHYHGIFGIEWLQDRTDNELFLLDFNARPFTTIGHVHDAGLNLPCLAYHELCGDDISLVPQYPQLRHMYWIDFNRDLSCFRAKRRVGKLCTVDWLKSLLRSRSFACWNIRDPGPTAYQVMALQKRMMKRLLAGGRGHPTQ